MQEFCASKEGLSAMVATAAGVLPVGIKPMGERDSQELLELDINQRPVARIEASINGVSHVFEECEYRAFKVLAEYMGARNGKGVEILSLAIARNKIEASRIIRLMDLSRVPLSSQLHRLTGEHYSSLAFRSEDLEEGVRAVGVITHVSTGTRFQVPAPALT
ncbi:MAG: hypothetical protein MI751_07740 [Pseudomonadales bacterium]|nr:hypothetical protein [Pseudomonadales bacterium]